MLFDLAKFKNEDSAQWDYFKALYYFKNGNLYFAKSAIKDGVNKNKYIGLFLMQWTAALRMSGSVILLLSGKRTGYLKFTSKKGKKYEASLELQYHRPLPSGGVRRDHRQLQPRRRSIPRAQGHDGAHHSAFIF